MLLWKLTSHSWIYSCFMDWLINSTLNVYNCYWPYQLYLNVFYCSEWSQTISEIKVLTWWLCFPGCQFSEMAWRWVGTQCSSQPWQSPREWQWESSWNPQNSSFFCFRWTGWGCSNGHNFRLSGLLSISVALNV